MANEILKYLSKYVNITEDIEKAINESVYIKNFTKGTILLKEGDFSNDCYFILKGCIRSFYLKDGDEKTSEFYTENQVVLPNEYGQRIPSECFIECVEDTIVCIGNKELETLAFQKYPQLEKIHHVIADMMVVNYQKTFTEFKMSSPEQRYLWLLKNRADLMQRAPQYQIASYLGIKPETLSRIRKRIVKK
ncbi:MAG: Crp/Fnr family transcriptional regulator [Bacteroidales bacterium]|jgi:CRP-like cAMP-binding protein